MYEKRTAQSIQKIKSAPYDMVHFTAHKIWYCLAQCPWFKYLVTLIITFISYVFTQLVILQETVILFPIHIAWTMVYRQEVITNQ